MAAYLISELIDVSDPAGFEKYRTEVPAIIARFGGRYLAAGPVETIEGSWQPKSLVVIAFDTMEQLRQWYESADYAPYRQLRQRSSSSNLIFINGLKSGSE